MSRYTNMNYYYTLGQIHQHTIPTPDGDIVWDKDGVVCVQAENETVATDFIVAMFGHVWAACYDNFDNRSRFYPKGIVHTYIIPEGTAISTAQK